MKDNQRGISTAKGKAAPAEKFNLQPHNPHRGQTDVSPQNHIKWSALLAQRALRTARSGQASLREGSRSNATLIYVAMGEDCKLRVVAPED